MTSRTTLATLAVVLLIVVAGIALLYATRAQIPPTTVVSSPTPTVTATATATAIATPTPTSSPVSTPTSAPGGTITGALQFPSNFIPPLTVYAISTADQRVWFSVETPRYPLATNTPPQPSYTINGVAPGTYYVVAYRNDGQTPDPGGLYSRFVVNCKPGAPSAACEDHSLVPVNVTAGQTTAGVDVTDWSHGAVTPTIPPRPTPR